MKRILIIWLVILSSQSTAQIITTFAGTGVIGGPIGDGGPATTASIDGANGGQFDKYGNYYVADILGNRVRKITPAGIITTVAGIGSGGYNGDYILATLAKLNNPTALAVDTFGNIYVSDAANFRIRKVETATGIITTIAGTGVAGYNGDNILAATAQIAGVQDICLDSYGNLYLADQPNNRVRKIDISTNLISTVAGYGGFSSTGTGDGGAATSATFNFIWGLAIDSSNSVFIADYNGAKVRKVSSSGIISTIAGNGTYPYSGDGLPATATQMNPIKLAFDKTWHLTIADKHSLRIYKIDDLGVTHCIAGNGGSGYTSDNVAATATSLDFPAGVVYDTCDNLYIAESTNRRVRKVTFTSTPSTTISIFSGTTDTLCSGTAVTYTASVTGGGTTFSYSWLVNGAAVSAGSSNTYTYTPLNGDSINCTVTTSSPCSSPATTSSNTIHTVVNPSGSPSISISASPGDTVCLGTPVTYTAGITNGGTSPAYQWVVNGVNVATGSSYTYTPTNGDSIRCVLTSNAPCMVNTTASSNSRHMVVDPLVTPTITVSSSPADTVCAGTTVTLTASITNGGLSPVYQWKVNGINAGTGTISYSYTPANGDTVRCVLTSNAACATTATVNSNNHHMVVNPLVTPTINVTSSPGDTVCAGTPITFTASITNGGTTPAYQWKVNGINAGTSTNTYSYAPANGDTVRSILTSNAACATAATLNSNNHHMVVNPLVMPAIFITPNPNDTVCTGTAVTYTAIITGGGTSPAYQWVVNGANVGTGSSSYNYHPLNNDTVLCVLTSNAVCASPAIVKSNSLAMVVDTFTIPTITLSGPASAAIGSTVTITATITGAGSAYTIYWMNAGTVFNTTSVPSVSYTKVSDTDTITAKIVPTGGCYDSATSFAHIVFNANVGIQDVFGSTDIQLYPNPAGDVLHITGLRSPMTYTLYEMTGRRVLTGALPSGENEINISTLARGIYLLLVQYDDGKREIHKVVKE